MGIRRRGARAMKWWFASLSACLSLAGAEPSALRFGEGVPTSVQHIQEKALRHLARTQNADGNWAGSGGSGSDGPGITGICVMAFLSSGEDPDYGPWAENIRRGLRSILLEQDPRSGYCKGGSSGHGTMYHHGFAQLALAEAYGAVSEDLLWRDSEVPPDRQVTLARGLELAVQCSLGAQKRNPHKAWRYSPGATDADTTVSGTILVGLLGARNAGIAVPDQAIEGALEYFRSCTSPDGQVSYTGSMSHGNSDIRSAIATLVYAMARRKESVEYQQVAGYIRKRMDESVSPSYYYYYIYYMAQALFQSDYEAWQAWNLRIVGELRAKQAPDGGFPGGHGRAYATGMSVLALALNYRLLPVYER